MLVNDATTNYIPVSYTHLDVYKRQLQDSVGQSGNEAARFESNHERYGLPVSIKKKYIPTRYIRLTLHRVFDRLLPTITHLYYERNERNKNARHTYLRYEYKNG